MKVLGIVGSRRKNGNTSVLVKESLKPFMEKSIDTDLIFLGDLDFQSCNGCNRCKDSFRCVINDDMQGIYTKMFESDGIILGSPTYFYNVTSEVKAFIDRCFCMDFFDENDRSVWVSINEAIPRKYASVINVAEQHTEEDSGVALDVMCDSLESFGYRIVGRVKALGLFAAGEAKNDTKSLNQAYKSGERLLRTINLKNSIKQKIEE